MNILFFTSENLSKNSGVSRKILAQVSSFRNLGHTVSVSSFNRVNDCYINRIVDNEIIEEFKFPLKFLKKYIWRFKYENILSFIIKSSIQLVYIRYTYYANFKFLKFLRKLKDLNIKVVLEIPTYPYDKELDKATWKGFILNSIEENNRNKFHKYIDYIVTFSDAESIFGVNTIRISNGIDPEKFPLKRASNKNKSTLNLIGVANLMYWHGFDRVVRGLSNYYQSNNNTKEIFFTIVSNTNNAETKKLKKLVEELDLSDRVFFKGALFDEQLDELFHVSDVGVGCLGCHRKGITYIKSIKNREYCVRGLPFTYSEIDSDFENMNFILKSPANESAININNLVEFFDDNDFSPIEIRNYATKNLTWDLQMTQVLNQIL